ncbi:MAG: hypothetical protein GXO26_08990 [Crenarchaeota archaeon]|nr:hypothetical protein [Thermoproteota archaeon]
MIKVRVMIPERGGVEITIIDIEEVYNLLRSVLSDEEYLSFTYSRASIVLRGRICREDKCIEVNDAVLERASNGRIILKMFKPSLEEVRRSIGRGAALLIIDNIVEVNLVGIKVTVIDLVEKRILSGSFRGLRLYLKTETNVAIRPTFPHYIALIFLEEGNYVIALGDTVEEAIRFSVEDILRFRPSIVVLITSASSRDVVRLKKLRDVTSKEIENCKIVPTRLLVSADDYVFLICS